MTTQRIIVADVLDGLRGLPDASVQCCVTSPPYWGLRDYGVAGQLGLEPTPGEYVARMVEVFREVRRVLRDDGTCWVNIGDSYCASTKGSGGHNDKQDSNAGSWHENRSWKIPPGLKPKDLVGIPWALAFALRDDGWWLRQDIVWHKPAPMPESVRDRCTKAHEYIFLLTKRARYFMDMEAVKEPSPLAGMIYRPGPKSLSRGQADGAGVERSGNANADEIVYPANRNLRSVWTMASQGFAEAHFATFPLELPERCIRAGTSAKGCCPECGAAWARVVERGESSWEARKQAGHDVRGYHVGDKQCHHAGAPSVRTVTDRPLEGGLGWVAPVTTTGWQPTCTHTAEPVPCTVLDPFCGAATTLLAAQRLGRNGIGIELNPEYAAMGERRLRNDAPLLAQAEVM